MDPSAMKRSGKESSASEDPEELIPLSARMTAAAARRRDSHRCKCAAEQTDHRLHRTSVCMPVQGG